MGNQYCVFKKDGGKKMGCSDNRKKAQDQIAAIYASEGKKAICITAAKADDEEEVWDVEPDQTEKQAMKPTQAEVNYTPSAPDFSKICSGCRFYDGRVNMCILIENYPADIVPTGYCDRWEMRPDNTNAAPPMPMMTGMMEGEGMQSMSLPDEDLHEDEQTETAYIAPDSSAESVFKALISKFQRGLKPDVSVLKGIDGARYMLVVTSNSYQDREQETITTAALKADVDKSWTRVENQFASDNKLLYWHDDRVELGDIVWADVRGPFLVELAKENHAPLSSLIFDYREAHPDEKWAASHRFAYMKAQKDTDGTYHHIHKRETSILPREAAANALTFSGVIPMPTKRDEFLNKMLGLENAAELLDKGIETLVTELQKKGIEHKSTEDKPAEGSAFANLLSDMIKAQADMAVELDAVKALAQKAVDDSTAQAETSKALTERVEQAEKNASARPRAASRAAETEIDSNAIPDDVRKSLVKRDAFWGVEVKE